MCRTQCCETSRPNSPQPADGEVEHSREVLSIAWAVHMASPRWLQSAGGMGPCEVKLPDQTPGSQVARGEPCDGATISGPWKRLLCPM